MSTGMLFIRVPSKVQSTVLDIHHHSTLETVRPCFTEECKNEFSLMIIQVNLWPTERIFRFHRQHYIAVFLPKSPGYFTKKLIAVDTEMKNE